VIDNPMRTDDRLAELLLLWEARWEHGEDVTAAQLCADQPDLVEPLQQKIDRLKKMAWMTEEDADDDTTNTTPDPLIGTTLLNRYRLEAVVGEGGFGTVYRAFDLELQRSVAVKVARPGRITQAGSGLLEEAQRAAKLRHPGIVAVHDVGQDNGALFIVTDYIEGSNLAELIATDRPTPREAVRLVADIADALHHAHGEGFIHRDIKPANILIDRQGRPLLTDFGLAADAEQMARGVGTTSGTLAYMAPEQLIGEAQLLGNATDIYALGVVLYELLTGRLPFQGRTPTALREQTLFRQPVHPRSLNNAIPEEVEAVCLRCLAKHPADRFPSAAALAVALRSLATKKRWPLPMRLLGLGFALLGVFGAGVVLGMVLSSPTSRTQPMIEMAHEDGVLNFNGDNRILTPVVSFSPCTLEAWVRTAGDSRDQFIVGSDVPNFYGIGLAVNNNFPTAETIRGGFHIEKVVPPGKWTHLAAVFGPEETTLFMDGKKIGVGPPTQPPTRKTRFVIGNVGEDHNKMFFRGKVRSIRISAGERYKDDFTPDETFTKDGDDAPAKAILVYGGGVDGDVVTDLSGAGNHGTWQRSPGPHQPDK